MAEEKANPEVEDDGVDSSEEELRKVADDSEEEVAEEEAVEEEEVIEEEPTDNADRSKLGRTVAALKGDLIETKETLGTITEQLKAMTDIIGNQNQGEAPAAVDLDEVVTVGQLKNILADADKVKSSKSTEFQKQYTKAFLAESQGLSDEEYLPIEKAMLAGYEAYSDDPKKDAAMNFLRAQNTVYRETMKLPAIRKNPLKGKDKPTGTIPGGKAPGAPAKVIKLDATAAAYAKKRGFTDEQVAEALEGSE